MEPATAIASFDALLERHGCQTLRRGRVQTLQVNVGKVCNQACHHCHVEAGPSRTESMDRKTAERIVELLEKNPEVELLDLTGGAPELNPHFRYLVEGARALGRRVVDRCNLTVLLEPEQQDIAFFLADKGVEIVASLPCYLQENVDRQRGLGVYEKSIEALRLLNRLGYGVQDSPLVLNLVYNPVGPSLPPDEAELQASYKEQLRERFELEFHRLLTLTNMPIKRFADYLHRTGQQSAYLSLLVNHFNPATVSDLMCLSLLSVGWDGQLYDCDFNQMLEMPLSQESRTIWELERFEELENLAVATASHCLGCTAGSGSSCGGALV